MRIQPRFLASLALCLASATAWSAPTVCVWDPVGKGGQIYDAAKGYALAMQKNGVDVDLKVYTDEKVAAEEFRVGQCEGLLASSMRTRAYNPVTATLDAGGVATVVRNGKIDMDASYQVIAKAIQVLASPGADKLNVQNRFEVAGIMPMGAIYIFVHDKTIFKRGFAGARMPAFDHDKVQAYLIAKSGAQPVSVDMRNFVTTFNNGNTDVVFAPAVAYQPMEIFRGVGKSGGASRFPLTFSSLQLVIDRNKFAEGFGLKSRQYWAEQTSTIVSMVRKTENSLPASLWVDYEPEEGVKFVNGQRDIRVELANMGFYDKQGLKLMKKVRCSVYGEPAECGTKAEIDW
jgi:Family of unknown function (DUF6091)